MWVTPRFLPRTRSGSGVADPSDWTSSAPPSDGGREGAGSAWQREGLGGGRGVTFPSITLCRPKREEEAAAKSVGGMAEAPDEREPGPWQRSSCRRSTSDAKSFPSGWLSRSHRKGSSPVSSPTTRSASLCSWRRWPQIHKSNFYLLPWSIQVVLSTKTDTLLVKTNGNVRGGFDAAVSQVVLCQNNIRNQAHMNRVVTHELIHAFDHCRAHVNWFTDVRHLACSEVRAANLSGDCSLLNEIFRLHFGLKQHHQTCVWDRAIRSILAVRNISKEVAQKAVDEVFEPCFNDHEPFGRIPHNKTYARYAHRDFQNRDRYYSNIWRQWYFIL